MNACELGASSQNPHEEPAPLWYGAFYAALSQPAKIVCCNLVQKQPELIERKNATCCYRLKGLFYFKTSYPAEAFSSKNATQYRAVHECKHACMQLDLPPTLYLCIYSTGRLLCLKNKNEALFLLIDQFTLGPIFTNLERKPGARRWNRASAARAAQPKIE